MKRCAAVALVALVMGCESGTFNDPFKKVTKDEMLTASARRNYHEINLENVIFVVSTPDAVKRVKAGKEPASKVAAIGFGPNGEKVVFESSKDGLDKALMEEFSRRHGTTAADAGSAAAANSK